jgi:hypothetical protein
MIPWKVYHNKGICPDCKWNWYLTNYWQCPSHCKEVK